MGMTDNTKMLIRSICENNIEKINRSAIACLAEDTTAKNASFVQKYMPILKRANSLVTLPDNLKYKLDAINMREVFREDRYYLTPQNAAIIDEIIRMDRVSLKMASLQIPYHNATLLYGPSGTGKTTLAQYVAYKLDIPYVYVKYSQLIDSYMGKTSSTLNLIFEFVKRTPCVLVLDEIDAISIKRTASSDSGAEGEMNRVTITLMQELDNLPNSVVVIAATNRVDRIDEALINRFPAKKEIGLPTEEEKKQMVEKYLNSVPIGLSEDERNRIIKKALTKTEHRGVIQELIRELAVIIDSEIKQETAESAEQVPPAALKYIKDNAVDYGTLQNWYIDSVSDEETPVWTEEHIEELTRDFYLIFKDNGE